MSALPPVATPTIEGLLQQLDEGADLRQIKVEVVALVLRILDTDPRRLSSEQKQHLVNAIGTLSLKRGSGRRMTAADLRVALLDLQKAAATSHLEAVPTQSQKQISTLIDYDMLRHAAATCIQRIERRV